jgi:hypothetical protein
MTVRGILFRVATLFSASLTLLHLLKERLLEHLLVLLIFM